SREKTKLDMGPIGKYENEYNFVYEGTEGAGDKELYKIKVDTILDYKEPGDVAGQGGLPFKIKSAKLKSKPEAGQVLFSKAKGRLEKFTQKLSLSGDLNIEIGGRSTKVDLNETQETTIETSDENPLPKKMTPPRRAARRAPAGARSHRRAHAAPLACRTGALPEGPAQPQVLLPVQLLGPAGPVQAQLRQLRSEE